MNLMTRLVAATLGCSFILCAGAVTTDISSSPLEIGASSTTVKPNVMLLFDDSGSMGWDYMPDWLSGNFATPCVDKPYNGGGGGGGSSTTPCLTPNGTTTIGYQADPPLYAYQVNGIYYNPNIYYPPGVNYDGSTMTASTGTVCSGSNWSKVPVDGFAKTPCNSVINLAAKYPETVYCTTSKPTTYTTAVCKRNGFDTGATSSTPFLYTMAKPATGAAYPNGYPDAYQTVSSGGSVTVTLGSFEYPITLNGSPSGNPWSSFGNPYFYDVQANEYCSESQLVNCVVGADSTHSTKAYVRYCVLPSDQGSTGAVSGYTTFTSGGALSPRCQSKYNLALGYTLPRYGYFKRNDIVPGTTSYARLSTRKDCASILTSGTCTYTEEMNNFANWYTYYHTRIQMAKTAVGLAFNTLTSNYRVGVLTINAYGSGNTLDTAKFVPIGDFTPAQKQSFYSTFYSLTAGSSTPLREALSRVGWYYAGKTSGLSAGMITAGTSKVPANPDPIIYSCQQNFVIMTTDGYWNGNAGQDLNGNSMEAPMLTPSSAPYANQDNDITNLYEHRIADAYGQGAAFDGNLPDTTQPTGSGGKGKGNQGGSGSGGGNGCTPIGYTSQGTLADVAMYYYKTDLRPTGSTNFTTGTDVSLDDVQTTSGTDYNPTQHMVTFTIGLGVDGYLTYDGGGTYGSADVKSIINASTGCVWAPGLTCNWPQVPVYSSGSLCDDPSKDDDLWHAAVNGRGQYLSAKNPQALYNGLAGDLAKIQSRLGAAAASATSTPNITLNDNYIYSTTFRTVYWDGELQAQQISTANGTVSSGCSGCWSAQAQLDAAANPTSGPPDTRTVKTLNAAGTMVDFLYSSLDTTAQAWFTNKCSVMSQCASLQTSDQVIVNSGTNLVNYLRGQNTYANATSTTSSATGIADFFVRAHVLGDLVDSRPAVVRDPRRHYADTPIPPGNQNYATYTANNASRQSVVYVGGNDGMLHAFNGTTGAELWAYVPRMLLPSMYLLSDVSYGSQHRFFVDGSPEVADVLSPSDGLWHTILIEGLNDGGRGYFAFDITNPASPIFLWEFCSDSTLCSVSDANLGLSFGNPVVTKRSYDGKWVVLVTSGYNNYSPGDGKGYLYELDPFKGTILAKVSTNVGDTGATLGPSGLAKITAAVTNPDTDNTTHFLYGGDLLGNLWRFDLSGATPVVSAFATLKDAAGKVQPITTRPELGQVNGYPVVFVGTGRLLGVTDLQDPSTLSPAGSWSYVSSLYALYDNGTTNLGNPRSNSTLVVQTLSGYGGSTSTAVQRSASNNPVNIPTNIGWMVDFPSVGERVNVDMQLVLGTLLVTTNVPNNDACAAGGDSWLYQFGYATGGAVTGTANNIAGNKTVDSMTVGNVVVQLPDQSLKIISTESSGSKVTSGLNTNSVNPIVRRVGWREFMQ